MTGILNGMTPMLAVMQLNPIQWVLFVAFAAVIILGIIVIAMIVVYWFISDLKILFGKGN